MNISCCSFTKNIGYPNEALRREHSRSVIIVNLDSNFSFKALNLLSSSPFKIKAFYFHSAINYGVRFLLSSFNVINVS